MMKNISFKALFVLMSLCSVIMFSSCGDDAITGCTDSASNNYDALATEDDGSCSYDRDKFLGDYAMGTLSCTGLLGMLLDNDALTFTISEDVGGDKNAVVVSLTGSVPVAFGATIAGDVLTINQMLTNVPIDFGTGTPTDLDMNVGGEITYNSTDDTVAGQVLITNIKSSATGGSAAEDSDCDITGDKQ